VSFEWGGLCNNFIMCDIYCVCVVTLDRQTRWQGGLIGVRFPLVF
jgi:hypothetical protein